MLKKVFEANRQAITQATKDWLKTWEKGQGSESARENSQRAIVPETSLSEEHIPEDLLAEVIHSKQQAVIKTQREIDYKRVKQLHAQQVKVSDIARKVNISRTTVYKYINADIFPEASPKNAFLLLISRTYTNEWELD